MADRMSTRVRARRLRQIALAAICALLPGGPLITAQQSTAQDQPRPTFRTEANYIRVDVYATTRDGTLVTDLRREDFELLEDGVSQNIDQFSPIEIRTGNVSPTRSDPRTPEDSRQAATEPRARVFVLFLDALHVDRIASQRIATPLTDAIRRLIGPDDLAAIVDPHTPTRAITFTRQIDNVESALRRVWGARDRDDFIDDVERRYAEPITALQDEDFVLPDHIAYSYYAIYNLFRKYALRMDIDSWLIVNQALSSEIDANKWHELLASAIGNAE